MTFFSRTGLTLESGNGAGLEPVDDGGERGGCVGGGDLGGELACAGDDGGVVE
jgi:hypothetical protein